MPKALPSYRKPLNPRQIKLLVTLYKFRFATSHLIASSQGTKYPQVINTRLKVLLDQEYIGRNYDSSYKIKGKQASYFLLSKGIRFLSSQEFSNAKVINALYHDKHAGEEFIQHCLNVFRLYIEIKEAYPDEFSFFSKSELYQFNHFPEVLPRSGRAVR